jgi:hypothetical protein
MFVRFFVTLQVCFGGKEFGAGLAIEIHFIDYREINV